MHPRTLVDLSAGGVRFTPESSTLTAPEKALSAIFPIFCGGAQARRSGVRVLCVQ
jgi:hypothetical protein